MMKLNQKALALCALMALPIGVVMAEPATETPAAVNAVATHTVNLNISGMT